MGRTQQTIWVYVCDVVPCSEHLEIGHHHPGGAATSSFQADSAARAQGWVVARAVLCPQHAFATPALT